MIVDVHSHDFPDGIAGRALSGMCRSLAGRLYPSAGATLASHLDNLEKAGIDRAVLCPIATRPDQFDVILRRSAAIRDGAYGARAARMIVPLASVHPLDPDLFAHLESVAAAGLKGVKLHPYFQDFRLDDPAVRPMFGKIADLGLVVQCHCGSDLGWYGVRGLCGPHEIAGLLRAVPSLRFLAAHLGGCDGYPPHATDELLETGCLVDTSVLTRVWHFDEPRRILATWPTDRILFGTDYPWTDCGEALRWVGTFRAPEDLPAVLGGNAARLFGL